MIANKVTFFEEWKRLEFDFPRHQSDKSYIYLRIPQIKTKVLFKKLSKYTLGVLVLNFVALLFASLYLWKGWHFRPNAFINLIFFKELAITFLILPSYFIWLNQLNADKQDSQKFNWGFGLFLLFLLISIYGGGMHNASNQIRAVVDEPIVYFYDELLSHYILMTGLFGMGFCLALLSQNSPNQSSLRSFEKWIIISSGAFQGLILGVGAMEAHFGFGAMVLSLIFFVVIAFKSWRKSFDRIPLSYYYLANFLLVFLFLALFLIFNGGFVEPSSQSISK